MNGDTVALSYDQDGLLSRTGVLRIGRHAATGLARTDTIGVINTAYRYDSTGTMTGMTTGKGPSQLYSFDLERDELGRVTRRVEVVAGVRVDERFGYDSAGRLSTVARHGLVVASYEYDENGNRLRRTTVAGVERGVVDAQDRMTSYAGVEYRYDDAGNLTARIAGGDTTLHRYAANGALYSVRMPDGTRIDYVIDPLGRRIGQNVNGLAARRFLYESDLRIAAELSPGGATVSRFVYGTRVNVPEYMVKDQRTYRIVTDHLGSVRLVLDAATGDIVQQLEYDEHGVVISDTHPGFQPFGFAGGITDQQTKLLRFGARDCDPTPGGSRRRIQPNSWVARICISTPGETRSTCLKGTSAISRPSRTSCFTSISITSSGSGSICAVG